MRRITGLGISLILVFSAAAPTVPTVAQGPPTDVDVTFTSDDFPVPCAFPVLFELSGKAKTIELGGGRTIFTSPGLIVTLTNLDNPANQTTLVITGAFHATVFENGDTEFVVTGRNLLTDPEAGFVLAIGRFSFIFDADGNLIQPLSGNGQLIDVCELLS